MQSSMAIKRIGQNDRAFEHPVGGLISAHDVPRKGNEPDYEKLKVGLQESGFDLRFSIHFYQMPNGDELIASGSHRVDAMRLFGEETIPAISHEVKDGVPDRADRLMLGWLLRIGEFTGCYETDFDVPLDDLERAQVDGLMDFWIEHNT